MLSSSTPDSQQSVASRDAHLANTTLGKHHNNVTLSRPLHALIIDDNKDLARLFADILEVLGCTTTVAWAGVTGLAMAQEKVPDIIFCDVNMPGDKNGLNVATEIRANKDFDETRLIAITGFNDPDSIGEARAAGFDSVFGKPIKFAQLKEVVESYAAHGKK
ncbi:MAG: response regulator [Burkholderiaceae bacterium]